MTALPLANLINELTKLPGVGGKSAARLAYHILKRPAAEAEDTGGVPGAPSLGAASFGVSGVASGCAGPISIGFASR